jgi:hypothetical protein
VEWGFVVWLGVVVVCIIVGPTKGQAVLEDVVHLLSLSSI